MKTYIKPYTQITSFETRNMLMSGNVSGSGLNGVHEGPVADPIEIY